VVDDNLCICDSMIFQDAPNFSVGEIENCIGVNRDICFPWARQCSSVDISGTHRSFKAGSSMSFVHLVIVSFVIGWTMPLQTSSMLMLC
jgi:hypothetical protein